MKSKLIEPNHNISDSTKMRIKFSIFRLLTAIVVVAVYLLFRTQIFDFITSLEDPELEFTKYVLDGGVLMFTLALFTQPMRHRTFPASW